MNVKDRIWDRRGIATSTGGRKGRVEMTSMNANDAFYALDASPMRDALSPSRFADDLTHESVTWRDNNICMPPACLAEILEWAAANPKTAQTLAATLLRRAPAGPVRGS
jgi:hypothetical protein